MCYLLSPKEVIMSLEAVEQFYRELEKNPALRQQALELQQKFSSQEEVINAFTALGAGAGYIFSTAELIQFIFSNGKPEN